MPVCVPLLSSGYSWQPSLLVCLRITTGFGMESSQKCEIVGTFAEFLRLRDYSLGTKGIYSLLCFKSQANFISVTITDLGDIYCYRRLQYPRTKLSRRCEFMFEYNKIPPAL